MVEEKTTRGGVQDEGGEGERLAVAVGGQAGREEGRRTRNEEILSTFPTLHAASYPLRVSRSLSLLLSLSLALCTRVAISLSFAFFFSPASASTVLLPLPRFVPSTTARPPFRPRHLSSSDIRHPPTVSFFSPRDVPSIRAPAGNHPTETIRPARPSPPFRLSVLFFFYFFFLLFCFFFFCFFRLFCFFRFLRDSVLFLSLHTVLLQVTLTP